MCLVTFFLLLGLHGRSKSTFGQRQGDATKLLDVSRTDAADRRSVVVGKAPADIFAGCCPSKFDENCRYWAAKFAFAVFPQRKVRVMKLPCVDGKQYESEGHSNERCEAYGFNSTLPMPDLLFCDTSKLGNAFIQKLRSAQQIAGKQRPQELDNIVGRTGEQWQLNVPPSANLFEHGVLYPTNGRTKVHNRGRPFVVHSAYEFGQFFIPEEMDVTLTGWRMGKSRHRFKDSTTQSPVLFMPQSFWCFAFRTINVPPDLFQIQHAHSPAGAPLLSTIAEKYGRREELKKTKFLGFMQGKCYWKNYAVDALLRVAFFDEVAASYHKTPTALGACRAHGQYKDGEDGADMMQGDEGIVYYARNEEKKYIRKRMETYGESDLETVFGQDRVVMRFEEYRFALAMHNQHAEGGVQEKITHAWLAHAVPVYWGDPVSATEFFNPDAFINCECADLETKLAKLAAARADMTAKGLLPDEDIVGSHAGVNALLEKARLIFKADFSKCIAKIREVDEDQSKWEAMVRAPITPSGLLNGSIFDVNMYAESFRRVLKNAGSYLVD